MYEAVKESLLAHDAKQQQVVSALVIAMVEEPLRTKLLQVFDQSETTAREVKTEVARVLETEQSFLQQEALVKPAAAAKPRDSDATSWGDWDVDVFWCESSGDDARAPSPIRSMCSPDIGCEVS